MLSSILFITLLQLASLISQAHEVKLEAKNLDRIDVKNQSLGSVKQDTIQSPSIPVANLEAKIDGSIARSIIERLQSIDADIGKLLYNSTSMYTPSDDAFRDGAKGGEKFTEILSDLDSLQDQVSGMINTATRSRQYNMIVRLRPVNNILYRIRNNLYLMRNSLVAINAVTSLEKISNSVIDSTLHVFMRPDSNLTDELGDNGNYDINLDKMDFTPDYRPIADFRQQTTTQPNITNVTSTTMTTTPRVSLSPSSTTPKPIVTSPTPTTSTLGPSTNKNNTETSTTTKRPNRRRNNQRRTTTKPNLTTQRSGSLE